MEIAKIDGGGGQFGVRENNSGHKNSFFKVKFVFGNKYPNLTARSLRERGIFVMLYLLN